MNIISKTTSCYSSALRGLLVSAVCFGFIALCSLGRASAQEFRGTISGTVTDPTGAVVKDAQVTITETSTGTVNRTKSDSAGQYVVPFLQPGDYQISIEVKGFKKDVRNGITLEANGHPIIDMTLQIGNSVETVSVTADAPLVDTANAAVAQTISTKHGSRTFQSMAVPRSRWSSWPWALFPTSQPSQIHTVRQRWRFQLEYRWNSSASQ